MSPVGSVGAQSAGEGRQQYAVQVCAGEAKQGCLIMTKARSHVGQDRTSAPGYKKEEKSMTRGAGRPVVFCTLRWA